MCPSTSRGTRAGSQVGIWLATAVISPNVNDATPTKRRMTRRAVRRSFRILRRRPFEAGARVLRFRRSKRRILALSGVPHDGERLARRALAPSGRLLGDHYRGSFGHGPVEGDRHRTAALEQAGRFGSALGGDPGLVRTTVPGGGEVSEHEGRLAVRRDDKGSAREGNRPGSGPGKDLRHPFLPRQAGLAAI